ncbi:MAG TPA: cytochrome c oxidase subunit 3 [Candidatus Sulfotelmatobacter sp.]
MVTYAPSKAIDEGHSGRGGSTPVPPGGGDDGNGGDSGPNYGARLRRARLGLICAVATVAMIFVSLTSAYIVRRGLPTYDDASSAYVHDWGETDLPWRLLAINTILLLVSSVTMELSRRSVARQAALAPVKSIPGVSVGEESKFPWLGVTAILGFGFLIGQWMAWRELHLRGFYVNTNPSSSFVFLLTATHAVHLAGGIVALLWASATALLHRPVEARRIVVDITAWYWHFMAVLWIYVFALLGFAH